MRTILVIVAGAGWTVGVCAWLFSLFGVGRSIYLRRDRGSPWKAHVERRRVTMSWQPGEPTPAEVSTSLATTRAGVVAILGWVVGFAATAMLVLHFPS